MLAGGSRQPQKGCGRRVASQGPLLQAPTRLGRHHRDGETWTSSVLVRNRTLFLPRCG